MTAGGKDQVGNKALLAYSLPWKASPAGHPAQDLPGSRTELSDRSPWLVNEALPLPPPSVSLPRGITAPTCRSCHCTHPSRLASRTLRASRTDPPHHPGAVNRPSH
eukprot:755938-Hanusia_phi.AAC.2